MKVEPFFMPLILGYRNSVVQFSPVLLASIPHRTI